MITFKQYLNESKSAPLYHGTKFRYLESILEKGFEPRTSQTQYIAKNRASHAHWGVSFSRSIKNVKNYLHLENVVDYVIFEVDQNKLNSRHRLMPVDYFGTTSLIYDEPVKYKRSESEEFAIVYKKTWSDDLQMYMDVIKPNVITAIHIKKTDQYRVGKFMEKYPHIKWKFM